jgi:hypothetical protein
MPSDPWFVGIVLKVGYKIRRDNRYTSWNTRHMSIESEPEKSAILL